MDPTAGCAPTSSALSRNPPGQGHPADHVRVPPRIPGTRQAWPKILARATTPREGLSADRFQPVASVSKRMLLPLKPAVGYIDVRSGNILPARGVGAKRIHCRRREVTRATQPTPAISLGTGERSCAEIRGLDPLCRHPPGRPHRAVGANNSARVCRTDGTSNFVYGCCETMNLVSVDDFHTTAVAAIRRSASELRRTRVVITTTPEVQLLAPGHAQQFEQKRACTRASEAPVGSS